MPRRRGKEKREKGKSRRSRAWKHEKGQLCPAEGEKRRREKSETDLDKSRERTEKEKRVPQMKNMWYTGFVC